MKLLFFGDIIGKIGRKGLIKVLPDLKQEFDPDLVIANGENIAHGVGATEKTLSELRLAGVDFFTSGNHIFSKPEAETLLTADDPIIIRPANYPPQTMGAEYKILSVGSRSILIVNLMGRVFMKEDYDCPFRKIDEILARVAAEKLNGIIVDFHAEATSEKVAFGWYADGRVTAVLGTHTHVPTADAKILPQGTAYISDVGMVGATDSVIGDKKDSIIESFLSQKNPAIDIPEAGEVEVDGVLVEFDPNTKQATRITRVDRKVII